MVRQGFAALLNAQPDIEVVGDAADGGAALWRASCPRRRAHGRADARDGRTQGDPADPARAGDRLQVLMLTTFDLDDYVYEALRAGASGFLLKDAPAGELVHAVRVVAAVTRCSRRR